MQTICLDVPDFLVKLKKTKKIKQNKAKQKQKTNKQ